MIHYVPVKTEAERMGILKLQQRNLAINLTPEEMKSQGFVTVSHSSEDLLKMHRIEPSIIAKENNEVIGYALAMTSASRDDIPILLPMFDMFEKTGYKGHPISSYRYIVIGQVCIDKKYRGRGVLDEMYKQYAFTFKDRYDFAITEIASKNPRSLNAHYRLGYKPVHTYVAPDGEEWVIVIWDWNKI